VVAVLEAAVAQLLLVGQQLAILVLLVALDLIFLLGSANLLEQPSGVVVGVVRVVVVTLLVVLAAVAQLVRAELLVPQTLVAVEAGDKMALVALAVQELFTFVAVLRVTLLLRQLVTVLLRTLRLRSRRVVSATT